MKVGFAARWSPEDKRSWSGISYYTWQQIKNYNETEVYHFRWPWRLREWLTAQKSFNKRLFKKHTAVEFLRAYARYFSKQLENELKTRPVDVLFIPASSQLLAYLNTSIPVIYMTDATFSQLQGYYTDFSNLASYNIRQGIELDKRAFQKAAHCMLASDWCRHSAIHDYGIPENRISVLPMGANMDAIPATADINTAASGQCRLLFLGVEWERKGGDLAIAAFRQLQEKGMQPTLHIVGCVPPHDLSQEKNITVIPFLDKNKPEQAAELDRLFRQTDFLLLPTRAECAGVVFSEAAAYGIPSITTATGGVPTCVKDNVNGYALLPEAGAAAYAGIIEQLYRDPERLSQLKRSSRAFFEEQLNWDNWGRHFQAIAKSLTSR